MELGVPSGGIPRLTSAESSDFTAGTNLISGEIWLCQRHWDGGGLEFLAFPRSTGRAGDWCGSLVGTEQGGGLMREGLMREGLMRAAAQANALPQWLCWAVQ